MLQRLTRMLEPAPAASPLQDEAQVDAQYRRWRWRMLYSSLIGYALFYFVRKNLSLAMPAMERDLHITKTDLGKVLSWHEVCYGVSKFTNGFLGDRTNPRYFMPLGLACSAVVNLCFGLSSAVWTFGLFWLLNGWFQGMGFPPCARTLTHWFGPRERGTMFGIWNTSHSIGAALALLVCSGLILYNWRLCFLVPAGIALLGAVFLVNRLRDTPQSLGLPSIERYQAEPGSEEAMPPDLDAREFRAFVMRHVLLNPMIWIISAANFFVYTVRGSFLNWGPTMLVETKHIQLHHAGWIVAAFEIAGMLGMLVGGWMTDRVFHGRGGRACFVFMLACGACILTFWKLPGQSVLLNAALLCAIGFFIYGPQCLVGVIAANVATRRAAATAIGVTGLFGYLSGVLSGWKLGKIVQAGGWEPGFRTILGAALVATVLFALSWNARHVPQPAVAASSSKPNLESTS